ncbi:hypothetical protein F5Y11DRAFT_333921 [Daldinia sp. FL1419]|nr:hypothetical protein F5Y11DRAFT_333921 [Daldinia sp. FL1419]
MFGIWHSRSKRNNSTHIRDTLGHRKACDNCRVRKVKCTGEMSGCLRCRSINIGCTYASSRGNRQWGEYDRRRRDSKTNKSLSSNIDKEVEPHPLEISKSHDGPENTQSLPESNLSPILESLEPPTVHIPDNELYYAPQLEQCLQCSSFTIESLILEQSSQLENDEMTSQPMPILGQAGHEIVCEDLFPFTIDFEYQNTDHPGGLDAIGASQNITHSPPQIHVQLQTQVRTKTLGYSDQKACGCIQQIKLLLDKLGVSLRNNADDSKLFCKTYDLGTALGLHKEAIRHGGIMYQCSRCSSDPEKFILLLSLGNQLEAQCSQMVAAFRNILQPHIPLPFTIAIGGYGVDTAAEGESVLHPLLTFHLNSLCSFVSLMASKYRPRGAEFLAIKARANVLLERLNPLESALCNEI